MSAKLNSVLTLGLCLLMSGIASAGAINGAPKDHAKKKEHKKPAAAVVEQNAGWTLREPKKHDKKKEDKKTSAAFTSAAPKKKDVNKKKDDKKAGAAFTSAEPKKKDADKKKHDKKLSTASTGAVTAPSQAPNLLAVAVPLKPASYRGNLAAGPAGRTHCHRVHMA